ncbi:MAG: SDR family oxidoreductase [Verrucomicrobia bacterium]|nr:SDR family oxidoreductase [Verrucomicrobiota bacterium]MBI3870389.1 SDR family oxidoreductase [Verrucomicrobiota bacterium]
MISIAWVTGAGGLIGSHIVQAGRALAPTWTLAPITRAHFDLADFRAVRGAFHSAKPGLVIHCAAMSRSPACEADPKEARRQNVEITRCLAEAAADIPFLFFSTDQVFDGRTGDYDEDAPVNPIGVYGATKAEAEAIVLANPRHMVIRTSLNGGRSPTGDRGFNEQMLRAWSRGQTLNLFEDEFRSPIHARFTAATAWRIALEGKAGVYHVAGAEKLSRWEIGELMSRRWPELKPRTRKTSLRDYSGAPRPPDTTLNIAKALRLPGVELPRFSDWLRGEPPGSF